MTKYLLAGVSALALIGGLSLSAAYANPSGNTVEDNSELSVEIELENVENEAEDGGYGYGYGSSTSAYQHIEIETDNIAVISDVEMEADVYTDEAEIEAEYGDVEVEAEQGDWNQSYARGLFINNLNAGIGNSNQGVQSIAVNADVSGL